MTGIQRFAAVALTLMVAVSGCRESKPPAAKEASTLASHLDAMSPAAQIDTLRGLRAADSTDAQIAFYTGNAYYSFGSQLEASAPNHNAYLDSAAAEYRRAVALDSTMSKAWTNMGLAYQDAGKPDDARRALNTAIKVNPRDVLAYCHLGFLEQTAGNVSLAIAHYQSALVIDPNSAQAHYNLGLAFAEAKVFKEALIEWEMVIKLDPDGDLGKTATENVRIIKQYMNPAP